MKLKRGVNFKDIHPVLWMFIGVIAAVYKEWTGKEMTITSLRRRGTKGKHPKGMAVDIRRWELDSARERVYIKVDTSLDGNYADNFARDLQRRFGKWLGIVLEPEMLTPAQIKARGGIKKIAPHIHIQLKKTTWPTVL